MKLEELNADDEFRLQKHRDQIAGHLEGSAVYHDLSPNMEVVKVILNNNWVDVTETWRLQSLGVALGDALHGVMGIQ
ncbi:MAG: hypothetical protein KDJ38_08855 [Gammaproteobacteria bacterium]|nr:hypothetical protein [Gammaproteobacteria bacterium]